MMSAFRLFQTPHGNVIRCSCCGHIEITFLGEQLRVPPSDFRSIVQTVARAHRELQDAGSAPRTWYLAAPTEAGTVSVVVSAREIFALHDLLDGASAMLELETMLHDVLHS